jgi:uncharacterized Zn finger protein (UPF0148 family)
MSDGFDKEAEREKLREKLADDEEERAHTQRMSELLLQGATMTNRHCDDCGDPIFRKDGQEFCPTCHTVDAADAEGADPAAAGQSATSTADGQSPSTTGGESPPPAAENGANGPQRVDREPTGSGSGPAAETSDPSVTEAADPSTATGSTATGSAPTESTPTAGASGQEVASPASTGSESVADARASLARTLNRFAAAAEETDDPRRARDHLQAAREAAEALAALDR